MTNPYAAPDLSRVEEYTLPDEPPHAAVFALNGRLGRIRYFSYAMLAVVATFCEVIMTAIVMVFLRVSEDTAVEVSGWAGIAGMLLGTVAGLVFARRRLQDLDTTPWILLLFLVPVVNLGLILRLLFGKGTGAPNRYGVPPPPNERITYILFACALLTLAAILSLPFLAADMQARG